MCIRDSNSDLSCITKYFELQQSTIFWSNYCSMCANNLFRMKSNINTPRPSTKQRRIENMKRSLSYAISPRISVTFRLSLIMRTLRFRKSITFRPVNRTIHTINISKGFSSAGVWKIEVSFVFIAATLLRNVLTQKMKTWSCLLAAGQQVRFTN